MAQQEKEIGALIEEIAHKRQGALRFPVMSGTVVAGSVDEANMVCSVLLNLQDSDAPGLQGILLNAVSTNTNGMILYPADNSNVWVAEIDGPGKWGVIRTSDLAQVIITIGSAKITMTGGLVRFNDGSNDGLVKVGALVTKLNNLENKLNNLITVFNSWTPVSNDGGAALKTALISWVAAALTDTVQSDLENTTVKH